jgi:hypothetical protein
MPLQYHSHHHLQIELGHQQGFKALLVGLIRNSNDLDQHMFNIPCIHI